MTGYIHRCIYNNWIPRWVERKQLKTVCRLSPPQVDKSEARLACSLIELCLFNHLHQGIEPVIRQMVAVADVVNFNRTMILLHDSCIVSIPQVGRPWQKWKDEQSLTLRTIYSHLFGLKFFFQFSCIQASESNNNCINFWWRQSRLCNELCSCCNY